MVDSTNTSPVSFHVKNPSKTYQNLVSKKLGELNKMVRDFEEVIEKEDFGLDERVYLVKVKEKQAKLFDNKNKLLVREHREAKELAQFVNNYAETLPKGNYTQAIYR